MIPPRIPNPASSQTCQVQTVCVGGIETIALKRQQLAELMVRDCLAARKQAAISIPKLVFSSNGQAIALAGRESAFANAMAQADFVTADGMSVVHASHLTNIKIPERIATTDFFHDAAYAASQSGLKFFILGGKDEENRMAVKAIRYLYPNLHIVGRHHGYFDESMDSHVCNLIRESDADVLWVGLGKPREQYWCIRNKERLAPVAWIKTCGGLYAFLSGSMPRAPQGMQKLGLEWLYRTIKEPRRLLWRYATTNPYAIYRMLRYTKSTTSDEEREKRC